LIEEILKWLGENLIQVCSLGAVITFAVAVLKWSSQAMRLAKNTLDDLRKMTQNRIDESKEVQERLLEALDDNTKVLQRWAELLQEFIYNGAGEDKKET